MSTSLLYHAFGVLDYTFLKTEYREGMIIFHLEKKRSKQQCVMCGEQYNLIRKGHVTREIRTVPIGGKQVLLSIRVYRLACQTCGVLRQEALKVSRPYKRWTLKLARYVVDLLRFCTIQDVADHLHMSWNTIKTIHKEALTKKIKQRHLKELEYLGVDEIALKKGHVYLSIVVDLESGEVVWVAEDRKSSSLEPFLRRLPRAQVDLKAIAMDMWPAYLKAALMYYPPEVIVFDLYHIMADCNRMIDELRRIESASAPLLHKSLYKGSRYLLLKGKEKIVDNEQATLHLNKLLEVNQTLNTVYVLKEELRDMWQCESRAEAEVYLDNWVKKAYASKIHLLSKFASRLVAHKSGILNYFVHFITTGKVEGLNNKIKVLKRKAYGFRDIAYFKLRIYFLHEAQFKLVG